MVPLIGIEVDLETNAAGRRYAKCYEAYFDAVVAAGGAPVLLPPLGEERLRVVLGRVQGVVVPGGDDFGGEEWGEPQRPCERFVPADPRRIGAGKLLVRLVLEAGLPYLGVCYGAQLLNLVRGGTLVQDIPAALATAALDHRAGHPVRLAPGSALARLLAAEQVEVNSRHHQAVAAPGQGLRLAAWAEDGVVEAIEGEDPERFLVGVQWHPEEEGQPTGPALFAGLVEAARRFA